MITCLNLIFSINAGDVAFNRTAYSNAFRFRSIEQHIEQLRSPSKETAEEYLKTCSLRKPDGSSYGMFEPISDIQKCGIGLSLYFFSLLYFGVLFLLCAVMSIGPLVINYKGNYYENNEVGVSFPSLSLGNVIGFSNNETLCSAEDTFQTQQYMKLLHVVFDACYTLLYLFGVIIYAVWTRRNIELYRSETPTLADYSIKFTQLQEKKVCELTAVLESQGFAVEEVVPVRHFRLLRYQARFLRQYFKSTFLQTIIDTSRRCSEKEVMQVLAKMEKSQKQLNSTKQVEVGHSAIFVFKRRQDRFKVIKTYRKGWFKGLLIKIQILYLKLRGLPRYDWLKEVNVKKVSTPEDIYWENIRKKRWEWRIIPYAMAVFIIIASASAVFGLKKGPAVLCQNQENVNSEDCNNDPRHIAQSESAKFSVGFAVVMINLVLTIALEKLTSLEKQSTMPRRKLSAMLKIFFAILINASFVILFVYADFRDFKIGTVLPMINGNYSDFKRSWYSVVGYPILISMSFGIVAPHLLLCIYYILKQCCLKQCLIRLFDTQLAYNNWVRGTDIDLPLKTALQLVAIFGCFLYAGGMPLMLFICALTMFGMYLGEQYMLRHYETPSEHSTILHTWFVHLLPWAAVLHCMFSLYMYGAEEIFPRESPYEYARRFNNTEEKCASGTIFNCDSNTTSWYCVGNNENTVLLYNTTNWFRYNNSELGVQNYTNSQENSYLDRTSDYCGVTFLVLLFFSILVASILPFIQSYMIKEMKLYKRPLQNVRPQCIGGQSYQISANQDYRQLLELMFAKEMSVPSEGDVQELDQEPQEREISLLPCRIMAQEQGIRQVPSAAESLLQEENSQIGLSSRQEDV